MSQREHLDPLRIRLLAVSETAVQSQVKDALFSLWVSGTASIPIESAQIF